MKTVMSIVILLVTLSVSFTTMSDVENHWGKEWIYTLVDNQISSGYPDGSFKPDAVISVEEFITLTIKALEYTKDEYKVNETMKWSEAYINKALELKIIKEGEFIDYRKSISREEIASIIMNAYALENLITQPRITPSIAVDLFDYYLITEKYIDQVLTAVRDGFITGKEKRGELTVIDPAGTATRAEAAVLLVKLIDKDKREPFISDRPHTEVIVDMWNGSEAIEVPVTFYAPKNTEGQYVTEIFDIYKWLEENETERVPSYYAWNTNEILTEFRCDPKHEDDYKGEFWLIERTDMDFVFDIGAFKLNTSPYTITLWKRPRMLIDYMSYEEYIREEYGSYLEYIFQYFFKEDAERALLIFYDYLENEQEYSEYSINDRNFGISGRDGVTIWFDEHVE